MTTKNFINSTFAMLALFTSSAAIAQHQAMPGHTSMGHTPIHQQDHQPTQTLPPEERAKRQISWMDNNMKLTDDQHKRAYSILLNNAKKIDGAMDMPQGNDRRSEIRSINIQCDVAMKNVLNSEQYQKYQQFWQDVQENKDNRRAGGMNSNGME